MSGEPRRPPCPRVPRPSSVAVSAGCRPRCTCAAWGFTCPSSSRTRALGGQHRAHALVLRRPPPQRAGLADRLTGIGRPIDRIIHRSVSDRLLGEVAVGPLAARVGAPSYEIHRSGLKGLLADALGREKIEFTRRCAVSQDGGAVQAQLADGGVAKADILIGADGVHSVVRDTVLGPTQLRRAEIGVWRGMAEMGHDELPPEVHLRYLGPRGLFGIARLSDEFVRWYAAAPFPATQPRSGGEYKQLARGTSTAGRCSLATRLTERSSATISSTTRLMRHRSECGAAIGSPS